MYNKTPLRTLKAYCLNPKRKNSSSQKSDLCIICMKGTSVCLAHFVTKEDVTLGREKTITTFFARYSRTQMIYRNGIRGKRFFITVTLW
jgi:hypothetical protein